MDENLHHQFFQNRECKYFPCHKGIDEEEFNCLFCYCPLYALGKSAAETAGTTKKATRFAKNAPFRIIRTITARS